MSLRQIHPPGARGKLTEGMWGDSSFWGEEKYDGDRRIAQFTSGGVRFTGRRVSVKDGLLVEKTDNLPQLNTGIRTLVGTVLDGEIVCADPGARSRDVTSIMGSSPEVAIAKQQERGWLQFAAFDILSYKDQDVRDYPLYARRIMLDHAVVEWNNPYAFAVPFRWDKKELLEEVWGRGGEGVILKNSNAFYGDEKSWIKVKREETYDVVVMGFTAAKEESTKVTGETSTTKYAGMVGAVRFGQYKTVRESSPMAPGLIELVECGQCSGFDDATRADMTANPGKYIGRAFEITAQQREPSGAFRHPRFSRWRDDKNPSDCVWGSL